jgi:hypothetical protein
MFNMKYTKTLLAAAALVASVGVNAQTVTFAAPSAGSYTAPTPSFSSGTVYTASTSIASVQTQPLFDTGTFLVVDPDGQATFNLGGVQSFSFLWGSPDPTNAISINGGAFMTGANLLSGTANSDNANTQWTTITAAAGGTLDTLTIQTPGRIAFELAVANPVPEPETYTLMFAGLGAVGFMARRRKQRA